MFTRPTLRRTYETDLLKFLFYALIKFGTFLSAQNVSICRISLRLSNDKDKESCGNSKECDKKVWDCYNFHMEAHCMDWKCVIIHHRVTQSSMELT